MYVSSDYGQNWTTHSAAISGSGQHVACAPSAPANIFIGATDGLYKSTDSGESFSASHRGIQNTAIPAIGVAPSSPSTLYIENDGKGMLGSSNSGDQWRDLGYFVECGNIGALAVHPTDPDIILALEGSG